MSLSFREQAAIALAGGIQGTNSAPTGKEVAEMSQVLADACCKAWGHSSPVNMYRCERCGAGLKGASK